MTYLSSSMRWRSGRRCLMGSSGQGGSLGLSAAPPRSEVRRLYPSLSFFFACLGASLGSSCSFGFLIENFVFGGSGLSLVLADLLPVLHESVDWFEGIVGERRIMSEVRSSKLETRLSFSDDHVEMEEDTIASDPRKLRAFSALGEVCGLDAETLSRFRDCNQLYGEMAGHH
ncbi:hypothetical protein SO802_016932 [Lithocarpus litseifolius]|uniref:Uncharacterized protein n=1 Tax=Lithocarpus litseifolius TaxID=425828 RepID=A0AAW2D1M6_9ROSI